MTNIMGREPLPDGTRLICGNGDMYTIIGEPIGAGGCSIVYSAIQEGEDSQLAIKECYPVNGTFWQETFYRENGVVNASSEEGRRRLQMLARRMSEEKEYSQKIYNRTICVVKMIRQLEVALIQPGSGEEEGALIQPGSREEEAVLMRQGGEENWDGECGQQEGKYITGGEGGAKKGYDGTSGIFFLMDDIRHKSVSLPQIMEECKKEPSQGHPLRRGGLPSIHVTAKIVSEILNALNRIHTDQDFGGYLHGDIQDCNIFFQNADLARGSIGIACMLDLGCMRKLDKDGLTEELDSMELYSTPGYIPPEVLFGNGPMRLGVQTDIYSLGRLFLYLLTGKQYPDAGKDRVYYDKTLQRLLPSEGEKIGCRSEVRKFVNQILSQALDFAPENRYVSAARMKEDIDCLCEMTAPARYSMVPDLPSLPTFTGRDRELEQLDELLRQGQNPIWIYGFGGMGKTELAIQFGLRQKKRNGKEVYRIMFHRSLTDTISEIRFIGGGAEENLSREERYRRNMDILSGCFKDCILIFDNMNEDNNGSIEAILQDKAYQELIRQPFTLVFTTRYDLEGMGMAAVEAGPLAEDEILKMMRYFYTVDKKKSVLRKIIRELGYHTLTAELAARTLQADREALTPEQLLEHLREHHLKQAGMSRVMSNRNREYRQQTIYCHIQSLYRISSLQETAKIALAHMLFLAPEGMDKALYLDCEEEEIGIGLTGCLLPRGWISCSLEGKLSIHPLIQELCMQELEQFLQKEYFSGFLMKIKARCDQDEGGDYRSFFGLAGYLTRAGSWFQDSSISRLGGEIYLRCRSGGRAVEVLQESLRQCPEQDEFIRGLLYCDMCYAYSLVGKGRQARMYGRKAMMIQQRLLPYESEEMARIFNHLGMAYDILGNYQKMLDCYQKSLTIRQSLHMENYVMLAISYNNMGSAHEANGDPVQAVPCYESAVELCRRIYQKPHPYLAMFCNNAGKCYLQLKDYHKAYMYLSEALEISYNLLPPTHYALIAPLINMANLLDQCGNVEQGLVYVEDAVRRSEDIEPTDWLLLAHSYFNYSYFLDRTGSYPLALVYGERALEIRRRFLGENHPILKDSYYNLKWLCTRMGEGRKAAYYAEQENIMTQAEKFPQLHGEEKCYEGNRSDDTNE